MIPDGQTNILVIGFYLTIQTNSVIGYELVDINILFIISLSERMFLFGVQHFSIVQLEYCNFLQEEGLFLFQLPHSFK